MVVEKSILELCNICGGMYNAVEFLIETFKINKKILININGKSVAIYNLKHIIIKDKYSLEQQGDEQGFDCGFGSYSYGYLKKQRTHITFKFYDFQEDFFNDENIIYKIENRIKKRKNIEDKMRDVDPYGEEEWLEEKLITKFKIFEKISYNSEHLISYFLYTAKKMEI